MNSGFKSQCVSKCQILTEDQIKELHRATLELLDTTGVQVQNDEGVQLLRDAGCKVKKENIVQIPEWLVEECIQSTPSQFTMYNRKGEEAMRLGGNNVYFGLGTDLPKTLDLKTGEVRASCLQDVVNSARTCDYLEEIDFIASNALPQEVRHNMMYIACFKAMVENSTKPIFFTAGGLEDLSFIIEMAGAVVGGEENLRNKPFLIHYSEPTSPLRHSYGAVRKLLICAEKGIPINYTPGMLSGATGPVTLAGGITVANAEGLSGIVLHQLKGKGSPITSGWAVTVMDMLTSISDYGGPIYRITMSACADIFHYYGIPMWSTAGSSDSHSLDPQAGFEAAFSLLLAALHGANLVHDVAYIGNGLIGSPAAIVMCSEIINWVKRYIRGFDISRDRIGMDVIQKVGPGGNFLSEEQTLRLHLEEHWRPKFLNRDTFETWVEKGSNSYDEVARQKAIEILGSHKPEPLPADVCKNLDEILKKAEKTLGDKHFVV